MATVTPLFPTGNSNIRAEVYDDHMTLSVLSNHSTVRGMHSVLSSGDAPSLKGTRAGSTARQEAAHTIRLNGWYAHTYVYKKV